MTVDWTKFDYENEVKIDLDSLELCCQDQPELMMKYAREQSRLGKLLAQAEENIKVTRSRIIKNFLEDHKSDAKQPTAVQIEAHYRDHKDHLEAKQNWIDIQYEHNLLSACVSSFYARRDMLQENIKLIGMSYFSNVSKTNGQKTKIKQADEATEVTREKVNTRMRNRR